MVHSNLEPTIASARNRARYKSLRALLETLIRNLCHDVQGLYRDLPDIFRAFQPMLSSSLLLLFALLCMIAQKSGLYYSQCKPGEQFVDVVVGELGGDRLRLERGRGGSSAADESVALGDVLACPQGWQFVQWRRSATSSSVGSPPSLPGYLMGTM